MTETNDALRYHGRRSVDELVAALHSKNAKAALIHKELSILHLHRFVAGVRNILALTLIGSGGLWRETPRFALAPAEAADEHQGG